MRRLWTGLAPLLLIGIFAAVDLALGPVQVVLGLVVIGPLLAASILGRRATLLYGVVAVIAAAVLGVFDQQYTPMFWMAQAVRLAGVAAGSVLAVVACSVRIRERERTRRLAAASAQARVEAKIARQAVNLAETLQLSLLTEVPRLPDLVVAARYVPAVEHLKIGGDWYAFDIDGRTTLVIGDVAGHDRVAAAEMAAVRHMLRAICVTTGGSPAQVLTGLDEAMRSLNTAIYATAILVQIDHRFVARDRMSLCWANAGHPPPLIAPARGRAYFAEYIPEPLLGLSMTVVRHDHQLEFGIGDSLVLYTDGLVEERAKLSTRAWSGLEPRPRVRRPVLSTSSVTP